jgi:HlyD family secretion protein
MDRLITKKKGRAGLVGGIAAIVALAGFFAYQLLVVDKKPLQATKKSSIRIAAVRRGPFQEYFLVNAYVAPYKSVYIDSREYGIVLSVKADRGSIVREGETLVTLQNDELASQLALKEATIESLKKDLAANDTRLRCAEAEDEARLLEIDHQIDLLDDELRRQESLFEAGAVPESAYRKARKESEYWKEKRRLFLSSRELGLEAIRQEAVKIEDSIALLRIDAKRLSDRVRALTLRSPAYAQIAAFNAAVGESKSVGSRIAQLDIMDPLKLKATLDDYYLSKTEVGAEGSFPYPNRRGEEVRFPIVVSWVSADVKDNAFEIEFAFVGEAPAVKIGQQLVVRMEQGKEREALMLEQGQFVQSSGGNWVYLLGADGSSAAKKAIRAGKSNPDYLEIIDGLEAGDRVIVSDYSAYAGAERIMLK